MAKRKNQEKASSKKKPDNAILDELALSLKKSFEETESGENGKGEESELEEDIRNNMNNSQFQRFMQDDDVSAPVLERIAGRQAGPVFVGGIPQSRGTTLSDDGGQDEFKYVPGNNTNGEPKYIDSDSHLTASTERVDFSKVGRDMESWRDVDQRAMFVQSAEAKGNPSSQERVWGTERFDERSGRKNPLEREETKYEKYKPDLPKSR